MLTYFRKMNIHKLEKLPLEHITDELCMLLVLSKMQQTNVPEFIRSGEPVFIGFELF